MKRRISHRRRGPRAYDIKKDLSSPLLAALGAVTLAWNDVEAMIDLLMCVITGLPHNLWREFTTRINGIDGKFAIIKHAIASTYGIPASSEMYSDFEDTLSAAAECRSYRDSIIHSRIVDIAHGISEMTFRRDRIEEVLLTEDALDKLYDRMVHLRNEIMSLTSFFEAMSSLRTISDNGVSIPHLAMEDLRARLAAMDEGKYGFLGSDAAR